MRLTKKIWISFSLRMKYPMILGMVFLQRFGVILMMRRQDNNFLYINTGLNCWIPWIPRITVRRLYTRTENKGISTPINLFVNILKVRSALGSLSRRSRVRLAIIYPRYVIPNTGVSMSNDSSAIRLESMSRISCIIPVRTNLYLTRRLNPPIRI